MRSLIAAYTSFNDLQPIAAALTGHDPEMALIQVFCGIPDRAYLERLQHELRYVAPHVPILGSTSGGEILQGKVLENSTIVCLSLFDRTRVKTHFHDDSHGSNANALATRLVEDAAKVAILFRTGVSQHNLRRSQAYLQALHDLAPGVTLVGGQSGVGPEYTDTFVFTQQEISSDATVAATLSGPTLQAHSLRMDGWVPIGRALEVTHAQDIRLHTLQNRSVHDTYRDYLGLDLEMMGIENPVFDFPLARTRNGQLFKNIPLSGYPDGSYDFLFAFEQGEKVHFSFCDIGKMHADLARLQDRVRAIRPETLFIYSCTARKLIFGNDIGFETQGISGIAPSAGFFTSTEFCSDPGGQSHALIQNMSLLTLSEELPPNRPEPAVIPPVQFTDTQKRSVQTLKILTHLISATTRELEASNKALAEMATRDGLTGLLNRRSLDQILTAEIKRHTRSTGLLSLLLIDVDHFKAFNDHYGHVAGDECLEAVAKVIIKQLGRDSDRAFRYGGEEMCCVLPLTEVTGAAQMAEAIRAEVEAQAIPHLASTTTNVVTVSIGYVTYDFRRKKRYAPQIVIDMCDKMLYQAKQAGRNCVMGRKRHI